MRRQRSRYVPSHRGRYVPSHAGPVRRRLRAADRAAVARTGLVTAALVGGAILAAQLAYPGGDARFAIGWGNAIVHGDLPSFDGIVPTKHPLILGFAAIVSIPGDEVARFAFSVLSLASLAGLGILVYRIGTLVATPVAGALACALVLTRPEVTDQAFSAGKELPFVVLILLGVLFALQGPREHRYHVLATLTLAGLLRPEAWLLTGAFALWIGWLGLPAGASRRALVVAALAAPAIWTATDLVFTGDPIHSFAHEGAKQEAVAAAGYEADTERQSEALSRVGDNLERGVEDTIGWPLALAGLAVLAFSLTPARRMSSLRFRGWTTVAAVVVGLATAGIILLPFLDQPFAARFFLLPGVVLTILATSGLAYAPRAPLLGGVLAVAGVILVINLPDDVSAVGDAIDRAETTRSEAARWLDLGSEEEVRDAARACENRAVISNERRDGPFARVSFATAVGLSPDSFELRSEGEVLGPDTAVLVLDRPDGPKPAYMDGVDLTQAKTLVQSGRWSFVSDC